MVVFTCQHCGDPVKKPAVEKHYNTKCRYRSPYLTCVDCLKDFSCDNYGSHNQCMTEEQRYSAQGTVFKEQKGKKKQETYVEMIQTILNSKDLTLSPTHRELLQICSSHGNVPRRLNRFNNFMANVAKKRRKEDIHYVFSIIEDAWMKHTNPNVAPNKEKEHQGKEKTGLETKSEEETETHKETNVEIAEDKTKHKESKKKRVSDKSMSLDDDHVGIEEYTNGETNFKPKKAKKKKQNDKSSSMGSEDHGNGGPLSESSKEENEEASKIKKEKHRGNPEENYGFSDSENVIDLKNASIDDIKENMKKVSKKELKKQKKYEKYLAELENEAKSDVNKNNINAELEEFTDKKKNKKKNKKLKADEYESEYQGLTEDKNSVNVDDSVIKADSKKIKKRKLEECIGEIPEKKIKGNSEEGEESSAVAVFNWGDVIMRVLQSRPDKELTLKKLGKKVVNEYQAVKQDHRTYEDLLAKFNQKVNKTKGVRVLRDRAKLID